MPYDFPLFMIKRICAQIKSDTYIENSESILYYLKGT